MMNSVLVAAALAVATPMVMAEQKVAVPPAASEHQGHHSASDRLVALQLQATGEGAAMLGTAHKSEVRDWARIDTNDDDLISPEEMEAFLKNNWAARKG